MTRSKSSSTPKLHVVELKGPPLAVAHEFKPEAQADAFAEVGLPLGLCLGSKSGYRTAHRKHYFVPNANVFCRRYGKVWWGDLDLWRHAPQLELAARRLSCRLFVLQEHDGRFGQAVLEFAEVLRRAVWHTGGRVRPDHRLVARSGLTRQQLALFVRVPVQRLTTPQLPYVALQINRGLLDWEEMFAPLAQHYGFKKWGHWMVAPNPKLNQRAPFEVLRAGETLGFSELFADIFAQKRLLAKFQPPLEAAFRLSLGTRVSFEWPIRGRQ